MERCVNNDENVNKLGTNSIAWGLRAKLSVMSVVRGINVRSAMGVARHPTAKRGPNARKFIGDVGVPSLTKT